MTLFMPFQVPAWFKKILSLLPLFEIVAFFVVVKYIGFLAALFLLIVTSALGMRILASQGSLSLFQLNRQLPNQPMGNALLMLAGFLLLIPGFITDVIGLLLLIPGIRTFCMKCFMPSPNPQPKAQSPEPNVIEGEYWREEDK